MRQTTLPLWSPASVAASVPTASASAGTPWPQWAPWPAAAQWKQSQIAILTTPHLLLTQIMTLATEVDSHAPLPSKSPPSSAAVAVQTTDRPLPPVTAAPLPQPRHEKRRTAPTAYPNAVGTPTVGTHTHTHTQTHSDTRVTGTKGTDTQQPLRRLCGLKRGPRASHFYFFGSSICPSTRPWQSTVCHQEQQATASQPCNCPCCSDQQRVLPSDLTCRRTSVRHTRPTTVVLGAAALRKQAQPH